MWHVGGSYGIPHGGPEDLLATDGLAVTNKTAIGTRSSGDRQFSRPDCRCEVGCLHPSYLRRRQTYEWDFCLLPGGSRSA